MALINLTPHPIVLVPADGEPVTLEPSGMVARVSTVPGDVWEGAQEAFHSPVPILSPDEWGDVYDLPDREEGVLYVVSAIVGSALAGSERDDLVMPGTAPADDPVRNDKGHIVGVRVLKAVPCELDTDDE